MERYTFFGQYIGGQFQHKSVLCFTGIECDIGFREINLLDGGKVEVVGGYFLPIFQEFCFQQYLIVPGDSQQLFHRDLKCRALVLAVTSIVCSSVPAVSPEKLSSLRESVALKGLSRSETTWTFRMPSSFRGAIRYFSKGPF